MNTRCMTLLRGTLVWTWLVGTLAASQNVVVILDDSGSMADRMRSTRNVRKIDAAKTALHAVLEQVSDDVRELKAEFQLPDGETPTADNWIANELVLSSENPGALMLHFSSEAGIDDFQRIAALSTPHAVSREMAKLEARLELAAPPGNSPEPEPEVSRASPPLKPVRGAAHVADSAGYRQGMSLDEYAKHWNSKVRSKLR